MSSKITDQQVQEIRIKAAEMIEKNQGKKPYGMNSDIGRIYNVTGQFIGQILSGKKRGKKSSRISHLSSEQRNNIGMPNFEKTGNKGTPIIKQLRDKIIELNADLSFITQQKKFLQNEKHLWINQKFKMPSFLELELFLKGHQDKICKMMFNRIFNGTRDSGTYKNLLYIIGEMNKKN